MLKIRLQRIGKKGQAHFRVVVLEHTSRPQGKYLELLGSYNPHQKEFKVDKEKLEHWMSKGAQLSPTVNNLLVNYKVMDLEKVQSWKPKRSPESAEGQRPEPAEGKKEVTEEKQEATRSSKPAEEPASVTDSSEAKEALEKAEEPAPVKNKEEKEESASESTPEPAAGKSTQPATQ